MGKKRIKTPKRLIIAIPIAPKETVKLLKNECDDIVVVTTSPSSTFRSVSQYTAKTRDCTVGKGGAIRARP